MQMQTTEELNRNFLDEYNSADSIRKYSAKTAGYGVNHLLDHDYAAVYLSALDECLRSRRAPLRVLEFGCGAGMNLLRLLSLLHARGVAVERAYGTDFSVSLLEAARGEARRVLPPGKADAVSFHVGRNEWLADDLAMSLGTTSTALDGEFDFIFGVNTFRYCHRLGQEQKCAADIYRLLRPGGICVNIDMNDRFPLFRSRFRRTAETAKERYLPSLEEYAGPFEATGFELLTKDNFCWVPHSAGPALTLAVRALTPVLNKVARRFAMRSLVVARKPL
jgi:SAM-dependent methyltransferase